MQDDFRAHLSDGEHVVWTGQPAGGLLLTALDLFLVPFSLLFLAAAFFLMGPEFRTSAPGLVFLLICLYFVAGRFFVDAWKRRKLRYALTDRRILILRTGRSPKLAELRIERLPALILSERRNGWGTIKFDRMHPLDFGRAWVPSLLMQPQFLFIRDARTVYDKIRGLAAARHASHRSAARQSQ